MNYTFYDKQHLFIYINGYLDEFKQARVFTYRIEGRYFVEEDKVNNYSTRRKAESAAKKDADEYLRIMGEL